MIATCGPLNPPLSRNASPSWNWLHSISSPRSRPFGKGRPSIASTVAISVSATWTTLDRRMLHTTGIRQYSPGISVAACVPISPCRAMTCPAGIFRPPSLLTRTPTSPARIRYRPFKKNTKVATNANPATITTTCVMSNMSATLCLPSTICLTGGISLVWASPGDAAWRWLGAKLQPKQPAEIPSRRRVEGSRLSLPLLILPRSKSDDSSHQVVRNRLVDRKLDGAFSLFVRRQFLLEGFNPRRYRVKSDVILERREVDEPFAVQFERRHLIADGLYGLWRRLSDCQPQALKDALHIRWGGIDVLVDRLELLLVAIHTIHWAILRLAFQAFAARVDPELSAVRSGW